MGERLTFFVHRMQTLNIKRKVRISKYCRLYDIVLLYRT